MKMKLIDRILLAFYTFAVFLLSLLLLGMSLNIRPLWNMFGWLSYVQWDWGIALILMAIALIFIFISFRLMFSGFAHRRPASTLLKDNELGAVRISISTLDTLAQKAVRSFSEVKDVKSIILPEADFIRVQLKITVLPDIKMPELTQNIQSRVKEYIEELSGISVKEVQLYIDNLAIAVRNRVE